MLVRIDPEARTLTLVDEDADIDWSEAGAFDVVVESTRFAGNGAGFHRISARIGDVNERLRPLATDDELCRLWLRGVTPTWMSKPEREFFEIAQDGESGYWPSYIDVLE